MRYFTATCCFLMFASTWVCALMGHFNPPINTKEPSGWFIGALLCGGATVATFVATLENFNEKEKR